MGALLEEWDLTAVINNTPHFWNSFPGNPMSAAFAARPLQIAPFFIAQVLSPNSFAGLNLVLMATCFLRVVSGISIGYFVFRNRTYAAALGMLFLMYPADTQQMAFRTLNVSSAVALMCCGTALMLRGLVGRTASRRRLMMVAAILCSVTGTLVYEPAIALYSLFPLIAVARYGATMSLIVIKRRWKLIALWVAAPLINLAYLYYAIAIYKSAYQVEAANGSMSRAIQSNAHYLVDSGGYRAFYDAWASALAILAERTASYGYIFILAVAIAAIFLAFRSGEDLPIRRAARYVCAGLIAAIAAYLPFMVASSHLVITQRTFIGVAPGASLIVVAAIAWICRRQSRAGAIFAAFAVILGFVAQLYQFDQYARAYTGVIRPYTSMLADGIDPLKRIHLVRDSSGYGGYLMGLYASKVQYAAAIRNHRDDGLSVLCLNEAPSPILPFSQCTFDSGIWTVRSAAAAQTFPEAVVQVIHIGKEFDRNYRSNGKWEDLGSFSASDSIFQSVAKDRYECVADSMWGYSHYCRGEGWSDGFFSHTNFRHQNFFAAIAPQASLLFDLQPVGAAYTLAINLHEGVDDSIVHAMKISINGREIPYRVDGLLAKASVPSEYLKAGQNEIHFDKVLTPDSPIGLMVASVELKPEGK